MQLNRRYLGLTVATGFSLILSFSPIVRVNAQAQSAAQGTAHKWQAELPDQVAQEKGAKQRPVISLVKGVGKELASNADMMGKDMILMFSARDIDPYEKKAPTDRPFELMKFRLIDGSSASLVKYPDGSGRINGGYAHGTVIIPTGDREYLVKYPNGARAKLVEIGDSLIKVYRPDKSVTTMKKTMSGRYSITNDKIGYMGEAIPDRTGLRYEFDSEL